jgi:hypothetical protein
MLRYRTMYGPAANPSYPRGRIQIFGLKDLPRMAEAAHLRPKEQWWLELRPIARLLCQPGETTTPQHSAETL